MCSVMVFLHFDFLFKFSTNCNKSKLVFRPREISRSDLPQQFFGSFDFCDFVFIRKLEETSDAGVD